MGFAASGVIHFRLANGLLHDSWSASGMQIWPIEFVLHDQCYLFKLASLLLHGWWNECWKAPSTGKCPLARLVDDSSIASAGKCSISTIGQRVV